MTNAKAKPSLTSWITLALAPHFSAKHLHRLKDQGISPTALCSLNQRTLQMLNLHPSTVQAIRSPDTQKIEQILTWAQQPACHVLTQDDPHYPFLLTTLPDSPVLLYIKGKPECLNTPQLALVGTRKPTHTGLELTHRLAVELACAGFTITSGMASGIDSAAHRGALAASGQTIAVFGCGTEIIYPTKNRELSEKIIENGAIVSEFPPNTPPKPFQFPMRNRLISGLSQGTVVIEAAQKSGSLITAQFANEQGREVFALPGSPLNPLSLGCHELIQQGAKLTTCTADIIEELALTYPATRHPKPPPKKNTQLAEEEQKLLTCIGHDIVHFEHLIVRSGFSPQKLSAMLCNLKLNGYIREEMGGYSQR